MENTLQIPKPMVGHKEITVVIVEDIIKEANELRDILEKEFPNVKVLGDAQDFDSAVELILTTQPMVVLMDIVLGGTYESFDVIRAVQYKGCKPFIPIFITAFGKNEYAVRAMKYTKIEYIDKPVDNNKLNKIMFEISKKLLVDSIENLDNNGLNDMMEMISKNKSPDIITVRDLEGNLVRVEMKKVLYLEAEGNRTYFVMSDDSLIKTNKGIKEYDDSLSNDYEFIRVHDAILLNLIFLQNYNHGKRTIKLSTGGKNLIASQRLGQSLKSYLLKYDPTKLSLRERFF